MVRSSFDFKQLLFVWAEKTKSREVGYIISPFLQLLCSKGTKNRIKMKLAAICVCIFAVVTWLETTDASPMENYFQKVSMINLGETKPCMQQRNLKVNGVAKSTAPKDERRALTWGWHETLFYFIRSRGRLILHAVQGPVPFGGSPLK